MSFKNIMVFDTSVSSENLGDQIIMEAVYEQLRGIFKNAFIMNTQTHEVIGRRTHYFSGSSDYSFIGGTNLLSSSMNTSRQWKIGPLDILSLKGLIAMGVGWYAYQGKPNFYSSAVLKKIFHSDLKHSVRDTYTRDRLAEAGIKNVIVTGCPTFWKLNDEHFSKIPSQKSKHVIFTLTHSLPDESRDKEFFDTLKRNYEKIYFWCQGRGDYAYSKKIIDSSVAIVSGTLADFDQVLQFDNDVEYVGTRLHAGIRAIQKSRRSVIIGIDNRAEEIYKDFGINFIKRADISSLSGMIRSTFATRMKIPNNEINQWKEQFI